ncbi:threonine/serine dehydratase [Planococcus sp. CP5-4]|uniref:threonine ammonia-lyase n=1 Tax=unclassified Planococcus (in: firmicutes) TaxID=2662419 RepID=UPI001C23B18D|nr:threonine/serine dehydratase [Planococcus sp. CP5-4]MBU9672468.1 threonine/serine dehydratase [Planococcus sp. CP5-4_YE]MBV0909518.1 threonine/serine dehydratase [Planococcus sp. CP5-4_UN]MBW6064248.1 threonine/serine dehydratase [Planococcus sp. CP5-4]
MPKIEDVEQARSRIQDIIHKTPILQSRSLQEKWARRVFFKAEHLQKTGSFKIRGAANAVTNAVSNGATLVTAASSGNHGQAVAYVAAELGIASVIVVPRDASPAKVAAIKAHGGRVEYCGTTSAERIPHAKSLATQMKGVYIPPYDHRDIIAGQGTVGLEMVEQLPDADVIVVPVGGGGLISGILTAVKALRPDVLVIGAEPALANDTALSLERGEITAIGPTETIADGLRTSQPGDLTFPIVSGLLDGLVLVEEQEIIEAMRDIAVRTKQLVEPSGAVAAAAVMSGKAGTADQTIIAVISGGNVDLPRFAGLLNAEIE